MSNYQSTERSGLLSRGHRPQYSNLRDDDSDTKTQPLLDHQHPGPALVLIHHGGQSSGTSPATSTASLEMLNPAAEPSAVGSVMPAPAFVPPVATEGSTAARPGSFARAFSAVAKSVQATFAPDARQKLEAQAKSVDKKYLAQFEEFRELARDREVMACVDEPDRDIAYLSAYDQKRVGDDRAEEARDSRVDRTEARMDIAERLRTLSSHMDELLRQRHAIESEWLKVSASSDLPVRPYELYSDWDRAHVHRVVPMRVDKDASMWDLWERIELLDKQYDALFKTYRTLLLEQSVVICASREAYTISHLCIADQEKVLKMRSEMTEQLRSEASTRISDYAARLREVDQAMERVIRTRSEIEQRWLSNPRFEDEPPVRPYPPKVAWFRQFDLAR